jgi:hypothetical protein
MKLWEILSLNGKQRVNTKKQLRHIERDLNGIMAAITQVSARRARRARRVAQIATGKIVGAATIGGTLMFVSAFGSASTGTAIGALSGAAATSAQMYWIGSLFGMGAVAGAFILPAIGAVLGFVAVFVLARAVFGRPRKTEKMQEFEVRTLYACQRLADPVTAHLIDSSPGPSKDELRIYAFEGLLPLCSLISSHLSATDRTNETKSRCHSFADTLALMPRRKLYRHHRRLSRRASKLARPTRLGGIRGLLRSFSRSRSSA